MVHRIAIVDRDLCQSRKCGLECIKECPVNINGQECIVLDNESKALISEELCIGCGICIKVCPFEAINIVNISEELNKDKIHQYGPNTFRLFKIPVLKEGYVVGLVGKNGTGKTTALKILSGTMIPNLGNYEKEASWDDIISYLKGREMKKYFQRLANKQVKVSIKPQNVYLLQQFWKEDVLSFLRKFDDRNELDHAVSRLSLKESLQKKVNELSGGELQRVVIAACYLKDADVYFFDEPSSYNDVYQRLEVSKLIRELSERKKSVLVVEHDITFLDYVTDYVQVMYGEPGVYGIVSGIYPSRNGINCLLEGYLPYENVRFRQREVSFFERSVEQAEIKQETIASYSKIVKKYDGFELHAREGSIERGKVVGIIGANSLGKTTLLRIIAGIERQDSGNVEINARVAYKPQYLSAEYEGTVEELLSSIKSKRKEIIEQSILKNMSLEKIMQRRVKELSGGELQKVAIVATLMQDADVYALDEPSAFLDVEDRFTIARTIPRIVRATGTAAVVIDHDLQLIDLVSDKIIVFSGEPGRNGEATSPLEKEEGMNAFLSSIGLTYRRDVDTGRPRINKPGSKLDREQKQQGIYYYERKKDEANQGDRE